MLEWMVSSSMLILLVLAVRALGKKRLSCGVRYALWLLVLARLLVSVQLFATPWAVAETTPALPERMTERSIYVLPIERTEISKRDPIVNGDAPPHNGVGIEDPYAGYSFGYSKPSEDGMTYTRYADKVSVADILRVVYFAGAAFVLGVMLLSNLRFTRRLKRTRTPYDALVGGMRVYVAHGAPSPCLVGVLHPTVYLTPESTRDEQTLRHVLAHETTHRLHGDCLWSLLRLLALALHWYNPLVWYAAVVSKRDGELACDEATLRRLGEAERVPYGETLLAMVGGKPRARELLSVSTAMTAGKKSIRERIETIARHPRTKGLTLLLAAAVLLSATVLAFSKAETAREPQAPLTAEEALDALEASVEWWEGALHGKPYGKYVAFTLPENYQPVEDWNIYVSGRLISTDGMTMSRHYFEDENWKAGGKYTIELSNVTDLTLNAFLPDGNGGQLSRSISLLPEGRDFLSGKTHGDYETIGDYLATLASRMRIVTYRSNATNDFATANVLDTGVGNLQKVGELSGLTPAGTLELHHYTILTKIDAPAEDVALVGGMYEEDGWFDLEGQGGHNVVALRYADGSYDVLYDQIVNDGGGLYYYEDSAEEALYDWYVKTYQAGTMSYPLYTIDLLPADELGNHPAHRVDGDGWYFYLPINAWYRADDGGTARWYSRYNTGSAITITRLDESVDAALARYESWGWERIVDNLGERVYHISGTNGNIDTTVFLHSAADGGCWQVLTQYDTDQLTDYPYIAQEPKLLDAMAASFTVDTRMGATPVDERLPEQLAADALADALDALVNPEEDLHLLLTDSVRNTRTTTTLVNQETEEITYSARGTPNAVYCARILRDFTYVPLLEGAAIPNCGMVVAFPLNLGWVLRFYEQDDLVSLYGNNRQIYFRATCNDGPDVFIQSPYDALRFWYDEAEYRDISGGWEQQSLVIGVPDHGQTYLEAAREFCDILEGFHLQATEGSAFRFSFVKAIVRDASRQTEFFRAQGEIGENTWCFGETVIFVPENERALNYNMAGNTMGYAEYIGDCAPDEYDPSVPAGACIRGMCGYITKASDGWHGKIVGTGW